MPNDQLKFSVPELERFGPCWSYYTREKRGGTIREKLKLKEGGTNDDSPRWQNNGVKSYMYHLMALQTIRAVHGGLSSLALGKSQSTLSFVGMGASSSMAISQTSGSQLALPTEVLYTLQDLEGVTKSKRDSGSTTIMHLCGNKWCFNPRHFFVGSKVFNDEQAYCHKGLHNAMTLQQYLAIREAYCGHDVKCWAMPYGGSFDLTVGFCATGLLEKSVEDEGKTSPGV